MVAVSLRLPDDVAQRLDDLAAKTGRSKTFYVREAIFEHLDDLEDYYLAADVLERIHTRQEPVHTAADVRKDLGLGD